MTIEIREKGSKDFYEETVNVISQYRGLIKKPEMKLRDRFKTLKTYIILCAALVVMLALMGIFWGMDTLTLVGIVSLAIVATFCWAFLHNMNKLVRGYLADRRGSVLTLDENGVELNKENDQVVRLAWDNVAFVRVFDESVCFLAKDITGMVISVNKTHSQEILDYLRSLNSSVRVIA